MIAVSRHSETVILVLALFALPPWASSHRVEEKHRLRGRKYNSRSAEPEWAPGDPRFINRFNGAVYPRVNTSEELRATDKAWLKEQSCSVRCAARHHNGWQQQGNPFICPGKIYAGDACALANVCKHECAKEFSCEDFYFGDHLCTTKPKAKEALDQVKEQFDQWKEQLDQVKRSWLNQPVAAPQAAPDSDNSACVVGNSKGVDKPGVLCERLGSHDEGDPVNRWDILNAKLRKEAQQKAEKEKLPYKPDEDKLGDLMDAGYILGAPLPTDASPSLDPRQISKHVQQEQKGNDVPYKPDEDELDALTDAAFIESLETPLPTDPFPTLERGQVPKDDFSNMGDNFKISPLKGLSK